MHVLVRGPAVTADGVIPVHGPRVRVAELGRVADLSGQYLTVGVRGSNVTIGGRVLDEARCETFAQLFLRAVWLAGQDREMTAELPRRTCTCDPGPEGQHHEYCHWLDDR